MRPYNQDKDPSRIQAPMYSPHYPRGKETLSARNGGYGAGSSAWQGGY